MSAWDSPPPERSRQPISSRSALGGLRWLDCVRCRLDCDRPRGRSPVGSGWLTKPLRPFRNGRETPRNSVSLRKLSPPVAPRVPAGGSEEHVGLVVVVRATPELDVGDRRFSADRVGLDVVVLQERTLAAAMAARREERAAPSV